MLDLIITDNVVYLSTYKSAKKYSEKLTSYRKALLFMTKGQLELEKARVKAELTANPASVPWRLMLATLEEVSDERK